MGCCHKSRKLFPAATVLSVVALVFVVVAFATDNWIEIEVNRLRLSAEIESFSAGSPELGKIYHSRHRGIVRECFTDGAATFLESALNVVDGNCFFIDFDEPDGGQSTDAARRMHLTRAVLALFIIALILMIVTFFLGLVLCCYKHVYVACAAALAAFSCAILVLLSIVMFHAVEYLEANRGGNFGELAFQDNWSRELLNATTSEYGFSYALAWVAFIFACLVGVLFLLGARALRREIIRQGGVSEDSDKHVLSQPSKHSRSRKSRSRKSEATMSEEGSQFYYDNHAAMMALPAVQTIPQAIQTVPAVQALPQAVPQAMPMYYPNYVQSPAAINMPAFTQVPLGNTVYALTDSDLGGRKASS